MKDSEVIKKLKNGIVEICFSDYREQRYQKGFSLTYNEIRAMLDESLSKYISLLEKRETIIGITK